MRLALPAQPEPLVLVEQAWMLRALPREPRLTTRRHSTSAACQEWRRWGRGTSPLRGRSAGRSWHAPIQFGMSMLPSALPRPETRAGTGAAPPEVTGRRHTHSLVS